MKRSLQIVLAAAAVLFLTSCPRKIVRPTNGVSLSKTGVTIGAKDRTADFTITAKADWTLTSDSDWIIPDVKSGKAGNSVKVLLAIDVNGGTDSRRGTVSVSASGESEPYTFTVSQNGTNVLSGVNKWIYETLEGWYYWNGAVKAASPPSNSLAYDDFLNTLILGLDGAQDDSENPATMDGGYKSYDDGRKVRHVYSYITRTAATRAAGEETTFGFDIEPFLLDKGKPARVVLLVTWVLPGGPAEKAGIKRGTWIYKYAGNNIYEPDYETFRYQLHHMQGGFTMKLTGEDGTDYDITAAEMKNPPILFHKVIPTAANKKVAYLVYNAFERGEEVPGRSGDGEYDVELRKVFGEFRAAGATELVLDLRYNPGGYVSSCRILTSLAADVGTTDIFAKLWRNRDIRAVYNVANPETLHFLKEPNSLGLKKIYVIETDASASASEMVINALRGAGVEVVHIGTATEGKNVGMDLVSYNSGGYLYEMWPITFKIMNSEDFCDYAGGFDPDYLKDEFWDIKYTTDGVIREFGDPRERLLDAALTLIDGGTVRDDQASYTRTAESKRPMTVLRDPHRGGAKYIPNL